MTLMLVLVTFPNEESAKALIDDVLMQKLAACILRTEVKSVYIWENKKQDDDEFITLFKTNKENIKQLEQFIIENHPYEIPSILKFNASANADYQRWLNNAIS